MPVLMVWTRQAITRISSPWRLGLTCAHAYTRAYMHTHAQTYMCVHIHKKHIPTGTDTHTCTLILGHMPAHTVPFHVPGQCTPLERQLSLVRWGEWGIQKPHSQPVGTSRRQIESLVFPAHVLWRCIKSTHVLVRERIGKLGRSRVWVQAQPSGWPFRFYRAPSHTSPGRGAPIS